MPFDFKKYYDANKEYYGDAPIEEVAQDAFNDLNDGKSSYDDWKKQNGIQPLVDEDNYRRESEKPSGALRRYVGDPLVSLGKGFVSTNDITLGLADLATGGYAGKKLEEAGYNSGDVKNFLESKYSPEQRQINQGLADQSGFVDKFTYAVKNPSTIVNSVVESVPSMVAGGLGGRALLGVAPKVMGYIGSGIGGLMGIGAEYATPLVAGSIGEGAVQALQAAEGIRQDSPDKLLSAKGAGAAITSGLLDAVIALGSGKVAQKLGIADKELLLAGGHTSKVYDAAGNEIKKNFAIKALEGALNEGVLQELPQSIQEQIFQNIGSNKPWDEGIDEAAVMGMLSGIVMGGGTSLYDSIANRNDQQQPPPPTQQVQPPVAPVQPQQAPPTQPQQPAGPITAALNKVMPSSVPTRTTPPTDREELQALDLRSQMTGQGPAIPYEQTQPPADMGEWLNNLKNAQDSLYQRDKAAQDQAELQRQQAMFQDNNKPVVNDETDQFNDWQRKSRSIDYTNYEPKENLSRKEKEEFEAWRIASQNKDYGEKKEMPVAYNPVDAESARRFLKPESYKQWISDVRKAQKAYEQRDIDRQWESDMERQIRMAEELDGVTDYQPSIKEEQKQPKEEDDFKSWERKSKIASYSDYVMPPERELSDDEQIAQFERQAKGKVYTDRTLSSIAEPFPTRTTPRTDSEFIQSENMRYGLSDIEQPMNRDQQQQFMGGMPEWLNQVRSAQDVLAEDDRMQKANQENRGLRGLPEIKVPKQEQPKPVEQSPYSSGSIVTDGERTGKLFALPDGSYRVGIEQPNKALKIETFNSLDELKNKWYSESEVMKNEEGKTEAETLLNNAAEQQPITPTIEEGVKPGLVRMRNVYGDYHYIKQSDLDNDKKTLLKTYSKDGKPITSKTGPVTIHRGNLDPTGEKQKANNEKYGVPDLIAKTTKDGDVPFSSIKDAQSFISKKGIQDTHEVIPSTEIGGNEGYLIRRKTEQDASLEETKPVEQANEHPSKDIGEELNAFLTSQKDKNLFRLFRDAVTNPDEEEIPGTVTNEELFIRELELFHPGKFDRESLTKYFQNSRKRMSEYKEETSNEKAKPLNILANLGEGARQVFNDGILSEEDSKILDEAISKGLVSRTEKNGKIWYSRTGELKEWLAERKANKTEQTAAAKEPYRMTQEEYLKNNIGQKDLSSTGETNIDDAINRYRNIIKSNRLVNNNDSSSVRLIDSYVKGHKSRIERSLNDGSLTPQEAEQLGHFDTYPDLKEKFGEKTQQPREHIHQKYVDSKLKKIDEWANPKGVGTSWERGAVKRFIEAELQGVANVKQIGGMAAVKIAISKAETFEQLRSALNKMLSKQNDAIESETKQPSESTTTTPPNAPETTQTGEGIQGQGVKTFDPLGILTGEVKPEKNESNEKIKASLDTIKSELESEISDWKSRKYKDNNKVVSVGGTADDFQSQQITVSAANEKRRKREIASREKAIAEIELYKQRIDNGEDVQAILDDLEDSPFNIADRLKGNVEDQRGAFWTNATPDQRKEMLSKSGLKDTMVKIPWKNLKDEFKAKLVEENNKQIDLDRKAKEYEDDVKKRESEINEYNRLRKVGADAVPGVRSQNMEDAGRLYEAYQRGEFTKEQWDAYVDDLVKSGKVDRPEPKAEPVTGIKTEVIKGVVSGHEKFFIGKNTDGENLYQDENGKRYKFNETGNIIIREPVKINLSREAGVSGEIQRRDEFKTVDEYNAEKTTDTLPPVTQPTEPTAIDDEVKQNNIPQKSIDSFNKALSDKNSKMLKQMVHPDNPVWRKMFEQATGLKLPKGVYASEDVIDKWIADTTNKTEQPTVETESSEQPEYGANNKIFTKERADRAREILRKKLGQLNAGIDPEILAAGLELAGYHIEAGARTFADYSKRMISDLGDEIRPYLKSFYNAVRDYPDFDNSVMTSYDEVSKTDTNEIGNEENKTEKETTDADTSITGLEGTGEKTAGADNRGDEGKGSENVPGIDEVREAERSREGSGTGVDDNVRNGDAQDNNTDGNPKDKRPDGKGKRSRTKTERPLESTAGGSTGISSGRKERPGSDYVIPENGIDRIGGWKTAAKNNLDAIELSKKIEAENRPATKEEQEILSRFVGWGASELANNMFPGYAQYGSINHHYQLDAGWKELVKRLLSIMTPEEIKAAAKSTQNAHYTSEGIIRSIYDVLDKFGFKGGKILEPGSGVGNFIGLMPDAFRNKSVYTGIERDVATARIAKLLYPQQNVIQNDFIKQKLPKNFYDAAIGNPPFASTIIQADPEYRKNMFSLHNYFFAKSIDRVRPGGLLVFVTSRFTMDSKGDKSRQYLSERADLIGAVRLPQTAFKANAGTDVVTDILFLRKREDGEMPSGQKWESVSEINVENGKATINEYYVNHPEMVLGKNSLAGKMYAKNEYTVIPSDESIDDLFKKAVETLPKNIYTQNTKKTDTLKRDAIERDLNPSNKIEGGVYVDTNGNLMRTHEGVGVPVSNIGVTSAKDTEFLKSYVGLRDKLKASHYAQVNDLPDWGDRLKELNDEYQSFVKKHGNVLAYKTRNVKDTDEDGNPITREERVYINNRLYRKDYESSLVLTLEEITEDGDIIPSKVLSQRTLMKPVSKDIKTVKDALMVSLNENGRLDIDHIGNLMGIDRNEVIETLGDVIFEDPAQADYVMYDEYLSGDVVTKLEEAIQAASIDPKYQRNVDELKKVQPEQLPPSRISIRLGTNSIDLKHYNDFAREVLGLNNPDISYHRITNAWLVDGRFKERQLRGSANEWSHKSRGANEILSAILNNNMPIKVTEEYEDEHGNTKRYTDEESTAAVNDIAKRMNERFNTWVWEDGDRASEIVETYNRKFNNVVKRTFNGEHLEIPGISLHIKFHPHQKDVIWRIIQTGNTYLAHAVGAGKTYVMIAAGMEMRRLGMVRKPIYVVPKHMLGQFSREFNELFPMANILVADEDNFKAENRRLFASKAALNDPDAIVMTHSSFKPIKMKEENIAPVRDDFLSMLRESLREAEEDSETPRYLIKRIESRIEKAEQKFDKMIASADDHISFEDMGADFLFLDEAHEFRKLDFITNITAKGISPEGSMGAQGLFIKSRWLEKQNPGRSMVFASGTPVTNTMGELYTIHRFFNHDGLVEDNHETFDAWAGQYGITETKFETNAIGRPEPVSRFTKFINMQSLISRTGQFMDSLTSKQLKTRLSIPSIRGDKAENILCPAVPEMNQWLEDVLTPRWEESKRWKPSFDQKNNPDPMFNINNDGKLAAIDMRFVDPTTPNNPDSKLNKYIDAMIETYNESKDNVYIDPKTGKESDVKGSSIICFFNVGFGDRIIEKRGFDSRAWVMKRLKEAGIPASQVAWMSDYAHKSSEQKEAMFKEVRMGTKRILIGSAKQMGTGVNVQSRLKYLLYLDAPWYPSDVEQPEGRILRQGNQNKEVVIKRFATDKSYDSNMWGLVGRKANMIESFFSGDKNLDTIEDISEASQYEQLAAMTAGDQRAVTLIKLGTEIDRLERLYTSHLEEKQTFRNDIRSHAANVESLHNEKEKLEEALKETEGVRWLDSGDADGVTYRGAGSGEKSKFGQTILDKLKRIDWDGIYSDQVVGSVLADNNKKFDIVASATGLKVRITKGYSPKIPVDSDYGNGKYIWDNNRWNYVTGEKASVVPWMDTFIYDQYDRDTKGRTFYVVELSSGKVLADGKKAKDAIKNAKTIIDERGKDAILKSIADDIQQNGGNPSIQKLHNYDARVFNSIQEQLVSIRYKIDEVSTKIEEEEENISKKEKRIKAPFEYEGKLAETRVELRQLEEELAAEGRESVPDAMGGEQSEEPNVSNEIDFNDIDGSILPPAKPGDGRPNAKKIEVRFKRVLEKARATGLDLNVIDDATGIKEESTRNSVVNHQTKNNKRVRGFVERKANSLYIIAGNIETMEEAAQVIAHELVGHYGLYEFMGEDLNSFLDELYGNANHQQAILDNAKKRGIKTDTIDGQRKAVKEYFAEIVEKGKVEPSLWKRFVAAFKAALKSWGFNVELSVPDVEDIVRGAMKQYGDLRGVIGGSLIAAQDKTGKRFQDVGYAGVDFLDVYHGTPHVWSPEPGFPHGRPRLDKSVEGAFNSAHGWGWSSAESEEYAKSYAGGVDYTDKQDQTQTPEFKKWFKESKVVDENGKPLVVYHGTNADFNIFKSQKTSNGKIWGNGYYFTENFNDAELWGENASKYNGEKKVMEVFLSINKPLILEADSHGANLSDSIPSNLRDRILNEVDEDSWIYSVLSGDEYVESFENEKIAKEIIPYIKDMGYDGIIGEYDGTTHYMVFNRNQIKSATENRGTFDPNDDRIDFSDSPIDLNTDENDLPETVSRWIEKKKDITWADKLISIPMYHFQKIPQLHKAYLAASQYVKDKFRNQRQLLYTPDGKSLTSMQQEFKKNDPKGYEHLNKYMIRQDEMKNGYSVKHSKEQGDYYISAPSPIDGTPEWKTTDQRFRTRAQAWAAADAMEAERYIAAGGSQAGAEILKSFRTIGHNMFNMLYAPMQKMINEAKVKGLPEPTIQIRNEDGELEKVSLHVALAQMGTIEGSYFPRKREPGRYVLKAKKDGENPIRKHFDLAVKFKDAKDWKSKIPLPINIEAERLRKKGYEVTLEESDSLPESVFVDLAGQSMALDAVLNKMVENVSKDFNTSLKDIDLDSRWITEKDGSKTFQIFGGGFELEFADILKELGGEYKYLTTSKGGSPMVEFKNPSPGIENKVKEYLFSYKLIDSGANALLAGTMATELSDILKSRGARSSMIARGKQTGKDVWKGYEEDAITAYTKSAMGIAGSTAKGVMAKTLIEIQTGRETSWEDYKNSEPNAKFGDWLNMIQDNRIDPAKQPKAYQELVSYTKEMLRNEEQLDRVIGTLHGIAALKYLAFKVSSAAVNLTSLATSVPATLNGMASIPFARIPALLTKSLSRYREYKFGNPNNLDKWTLEAFEHIEREGWDQQQFNHEAMNALQGKLGAKFNKLMEYGMVGFKVTEMMNRVSTIMAAYQGIKEKTEGEWTQEKHEAALNKANEISDRAHGDYSKGNQPAFTRGGGVAGNLAKMAYIFKMYQHNYLLNMKKLGFDKEYKALAYMAVSPAILAGAGASVMTPIISAFAGALGFGGDDPEEEFYKWIEREVGGTAASYARTGAIGLGGYGMSLGGSMDINIMQYPKNFYELLGAPGGVAKDLVDGFKSIQQGDYLKGAEKISPVNALAQPVRAYRESTEGFTTAKNTPVYYGKEQLKLDAIEAAMRTFGFNPARTAIIRDKQYGEKKASAVMQDQLNSIYSKAKKVFMSPASDRSEKDIANIMELMTQYNDAIKSDETLKRTRTPLTWSRIMRGVNRQLKPQKSERLRDIDDSYLQ